MDKKEPIRLREDESSTLWLIPVYLKGKFVDYTECRQFKTTPENLELVRAAITISNIISLNRQIKTDVLNEARRSTSISAKLRSLSEEERSLISSEYFKALEAQGAPFFPVRVIWTRFRRFFRTLLHLG